MALQFTDANFENEVLKSKIPVLVDFWAPWCGPCRKLGPIIEEVVEALPADKFKIGKMNVDENQTTPNRYNIMSIPTMLIFRDGQPVDQIVGAVPKAAIVEKLMSHSS